MPSPFHADAIDVLYEADPACIGAIEETVSESRLRTLALPYALGARRERRMFHFHLNPHTNSFQELNPHYDSFFEFQGGRDYIMKEVTRTLEQAELDVQTLDHLAGGTDRPVPGPDFLFTDTEGSDYDVLAGARESLRARGLAVTVEAQFQPIWRGQRLFGDICRLLDELGFDLASVYPHDGLSPHRTPIGLRGRSFHAGCDAVFLKRIDAVAAATPDADARWIRTRKLAFGALLLGHVAYGIKSLTAARGIPASSEIRAAARSVSYMTFLDEVEETIARAPAHVPPLYAGPAPRQARPVVRYGRIKGILAMVPGVLAVALALVGAGRRLRSAARDAVSTLPGTHTRSQDTEFERLLVRYGLANVADVVRTRRILEEPFAREEPRAPHAQ